MRFDSLREACCVCRLCRCSALCVSGRRAALHANHEQPPCRVQRPMQLIVFLFGCCCKTSHLYEALADATLLELLERDELVGEMPLTELGDLSAPCRAAHRRNDAVIAASKPMSACAKSAAGSHERPLALVVAGTRQRTEDAEAAAAHHGRRKRQRCPLLCRRGALPSPHGLQAQRM